MPSVEPKSANFQFLAKHDAHLLKLATGAKAYCFTEPDLSLTRLRQLCEGIATRVARYSPTAQDKQPDFYTLINSMRDDQILTSELVDAFHTVRKLCNHPVHTGEAELGTALHALKIGRGIAVWFHRLTHPSFKPGAFIPPPRPTDPSEELAAELEELKDKLAKEHQALEKAQDRITSLSEAREEAEALAAKAYEDQLAAIELAQESEEKLQAAQALFINDQAAQEKPTSTETAAVKQAASKASKAFLAEMDETETREIIDTQMRDAGWEVNTNAIRFAKGSRPEMGKNKAIAEWPTASGPVDYAFFIARELVAVAEAKRFGVDIPAKHSSQTLRYARDVDNKGYPFPEGSPWIDFKVPYAFTSNGRPYLQQLEEKSGVYFQDLRLPTNKALAIDGWRTPEGLLAELQQDVPKANAELAESPVDLPGLRPYQIEAISEVEKAIAGNQRELLLAMATGTGKTRTAISLIYRLVKAKRFRRILFLVDRTELGTQAFENGFEQIKLEGISTFTEIYNVARLGETKIEAETKVHIATVQSMVRRVTQVSDEPPPPVDHYDCIIIDECHRGYNLDKEMDAHELTFRSEADFISKYRRVVEHFHAVKIGLTATPAQHTAEIFGRPVFTYSYREAVTDGFLCDHTPPVRLITALTQHGIKWEKGEAMQLYNPKDGSIDLETAPDEVLKEVDAFNTQVITKPFNQTVCQELAQYLDPEIPGKALIFCATDHHADIFVKALKDALDAHYGPQPDSLITKITGAAVAGDKSLVRRFKNEVDPKYVVTVDLLTTGVDIPAITKLVFVRRVKSRILYEQMLGRATRLCEDLFGEGQDKEVFEIFDTVDLYSAIEDFNTMKPVVKNPSASVTEMLEFIRSALAADDAKSADAFNTELVVKLRRLRKRIYKKADELATRFDGLTAETLLEQVSHSPAETLRLFESQPELAEWLSKLSKQKNHSSMLLSEHEDRILHVERGYGAGREKPEDYLNRFNQWIEDHKNSHTALNLVLTAPGSLNRQSLKELVLALADEHFTERDLRPAWREVKHQDCAAHLIGYIRSQALGSPLVPFEQRVDQAVTRIRSKSDFQWTENQIRWLERIVTQIKKQALVDKDSLNTGAFNSAGGFNRINKSFSGKLETLLEDLHTEIWNDGAA